MASTSTLPAQALNAARTALSVAINESGSENAKHDFQDPLEDGEIQELDMQAHAEEIRTVFSDPTNFNVKVRCALS